MYFCRMGKNKFAIIDGVEIVDLGAKGKAVGKKDGMVYFVEGAVPGDVCSIRTTRKRKGFIEGKAVAFSQYSTERVDPVCAHFGTCGGCKWQSLDYAAQLRYKAKDVANNLKKLGNIIPQETLPILGSKEAYNYRNKLEFTFTNHRWLTQNEVDSTEQEIDRNGVGFHIPGFWDKVLHVEKCHLQAEPSNAIRNFCYQFAKQNNISFYNLRDKNGLLRTLMIRTTSLNEVMVFFQFGEENIEAITLILEALKNEFSEITSLQYAINTKQNDSMYDLDVVCYYGKNYITEQMPAYFEGNKPLNFHVGPKSFYQTNSDQAFELYKTALDFAGLTGGETVYDLYTGTGTIALFIAQKAKKVVGVESVKEAIDDAWLNAEVNGITNADFVVGDMKDVFTPEFIQTHGRPDVIVTDPPRDGMHQKVVQQLLELAAPRIIYVSCNPATQARDLALLNELYEVKISRAVDMFPQTQHIENVVLLEKK